MDTSDYVVDMGMAVNVARLVVGVNDLFTMNPELAAQWHPTKNGALTPEDVLPGSHKKAWWLCSLFHDWEAKIESRSKGTGCPTCNGKRVQVGFNDFATANPKLAEQWHPTKNGMTTPQDVTPGSHKKAWWLCPLLHEWEASVKSRNSGNGCPYCSGNRVLVGFNDLGTIKPELVAQWHPAKNGKLTPQDVTVSANRKAWWVCKFFHEWEAVVANRSSGEGCPYCSGNRVLAGFNDLATVNPELASQWHPTNNGAVNPQDVTVGAKKKVWWICSLSHEWEAAVSNRTAGRSCPICSGNRVLVGFNDLGTIKPELVAQWHPTKNGKLTPQDVTVSANGKVWWICALLHEWEAAVSSRSAGRGCPTCTGRRIQIGFNDLATLSPEIAAQWHPKNNGTLTPKNVTFSSGKKVWWICSLSHEWETTINARSDGNGCPRCSAGVTERTFREAFEKFSKVDFGSDRIYLIRGSRKLNRAQIDMLNDDLKLVIEYDGEWPHGANGPEGKTLEQKLAEDKETTQALIDIGYKVIRVREYSNKDILPFVLLDPEYESGVFQIVYKSFGKDKDNIEMLVQDIIKKKACWFNVSGIVDHLEANLAVI